jgi:hypothetical protein
MFGQKFEICFELVWQKMYDSIEFQVFQDRSTTTIVQIGTEKFSEEFFCI